MNITEITTSAGRDKRRKRVGRGKGAGQGKTCGRGHKGAGSRSGFRPFKLKEGGQMPAFRRMPKRGFTVKHRIHAGEGIEGRRVRHTAASTDVGTRKEKQKEGSDESRLPRPSG